MRSLAHPPPPPQTQIEAHEVLYGGSHMTGVIMFQWVTRREMRE